MIRSSMDKMKRGREIRLLSENERIDYMLKNGVAADRTTAKLILEASKKRGD